MKLLYLDQNKWIDLASAYKESKMSICSGLDDIIDNHLRVADIGSSAPHYAFIKSALRLSEKAPKQFNAELLLSEMLSCVENNWQSSPRRFSNRPSKENWRWEKQCNIAPHNPSLEKTLEKTIVKVTEEDWINQVPTASGLYSEQHDKQRNIDLVHRLQAGEYEFFELKVNSDTPLKASMEVVQYAILYIFSRLHYTLTEQKSHELMQAKAIHLCVLAPSKYFTRYNFFWLARSLDIGLKTFLANQSFTMDFQFMKFPLSFIWPCSDQDCAAALLGIEPVTWNNKNEKDLYPLKRSG